VSENVGGIHYEVELDTSKLVRGQREVSSAISQAASSFNAITAAVKLYAAALAVVRSVQLADEMRMLAARIDVAAGSAEKGADAMRALEGIARRTGTSIAANAEVFGRLNQSLLQMGGTQQDTLQVTELLGKAIKVSGASAVEAKAAMLQFGQALGSGKLAGDELRSLMENAPYLMRQLADGIGVPIGSLKKLGEEGKLTSDVVINALSKAADKIDSDFKQLPQTFDSALSVARDAFGRVVLAMDEASQKSAALTGITKGVGEVFDFVAGQIKATNEAQDALNRSRAIDEWADRSRTALSYVADAAASVWQNISNSRVAQAMGKVPDVLKNTGIGKMLASLGQDGEGLTIGDKTYRLGSGNDRAGTPQELPGEKMRRLAQQQADALATGSDYKDRSDRLKDIRPKLKTPDTGGKKDKFDEAAYLSGLAQKAADEREKVTIIEEEAYRKAAELRKKGEITEKQYQTARTLIAEAAARSRFEIEDKANKEIERTVKQANDMIAADDKRAADARVKAREDANAILDSANPISKLRAELEQKSALLTEYAQKDQDNALLYEAAKVELARQTAEKIKEIEDKRASDQLAAQTMLMQGYGSLFGSMADMAKAFGGEQSKTYKALFAVSKAFAIAESLVKIQQGIAAASALPFPANIPAMATVASMTAGIVSTIKGVNFGGGRQYGGPVGAGTMYRVNEGGRPEMFTAANGAQYMMPTADGRVTPAGAGGGVAWNIVVNNNAQGATATASVDEQGRTVTIAIAQIADQIRNNSGPVWSALRSSSNVAPRIS
jgi:tape measure domain-containing protein